MDLWQPFRVLQEHYSAPPSSAPQDERLNELLVTIERSLRRRRRGKVEPFVVPFTQRIFLNMMRLNAET